MIEFFNPAGDSTSFIEVYQYNAFYYYGIADEWVPRLKQVTPYAASSEDALKLEGYNWGYWLQVRQPQG